MVFHNYGLGGVGDESFVTTEQEPDLPESRIITAGPGIQLVDSGTNITIVSTGSGGGGGSSTAKYVVMAADSSVPNARVITPGPFIEITDNISSVVIQATGIVADTISPVTMVTEASLPNSRRIVNSNGIALTDTGSDLVISVDSSVTRNTAIQTLTNKILSAPVIDYRVVSINADYTAVSGDNVILVDASGGDIIVTLSNTSAMNQEQVMVKKIDTSAFKVTISSTDGIDSLTDQLLEQPFESFTMISIGTTWFIV